MKRNFRPFHYVLLVIVGIALASTAFIHPPDSEPIRELTGSKAIFLFFSGWLGSMAMLLPGVSGSFVLLLLGSYSTAIAALSNLNLPIIAVVGAGVIVGFIISSRIIHYLLNAFPSAMYAIIIGLILGSVFAIFPGVPSGLGSLAVSAIMFVAGLLFTVWLGKVDASR